MIFPKSFYDVDFTILSEKVTPPFLRKPKMLAWLTSLLAPLQNVRNEFFEKYYYNGGANFLNTNTISVDERLKYNSQTILLEFILNKAFGITTAPLIFIVNATGFADTEFLSSVTSGDVPSYWGDSPNDSDTVFLQNEIEYLPAFDFTVYVPLAVYNTLGTTNPQRDARVQKEVDKYKIIGTTNNIISY